MATAPLASPASNAPQWGEEGRRPCLETERLKAQPLDICAFPKRRVPSLSCAAPCLGGGQSSRNKTPAMYGTRTIAPAPGSDTSEHTTMHDNAPSCIFGSFSPIPHMSATRSFCIRFISHMRTPFHCQLLRAFWAKGKRVVLRFIFLSPLASIQTLRLLLPRPARRRRTGCRCAAVGPA